MNVGAYRLYDVLLPSMSYATLHHIASELIKAQTMSKDQRFREHAEALLEIILDKIENMDTPDEWHLSGGDYPREDDNV